MSHWYFAYGSNMNQIRMRDRGMQVVGARSGWMQNVRLVFNKRAADQDGIAYANIAHAPGDRVEGVLYELADVGEIVRMDPFEGAPRFYSRDVFPIETGQSGQQPAWVYVANRAMICEGLKPAAWYLAHLLEGRAYLSEAYFQRLVQVETAG